LVFLDLILGSFDFVRSAYARAMAATKTMLNQPELISWPSWLLSLGTVLLALVQGEARACVHAVLLVGLRVRDLADLADLADPAGQCRAAKQTYAGGGEFF